MNSHGSGSVAADRAEETTVSVIVPCSDDTYISGTLESLAEQGETDFEVIVVDASMDGVVSQNLKPWSDRLQLRVVGGARARSAGHQRNRGVAESRGEFLLFVDADDIVAEGYVRAMAEALRSQWFVCSRVDVQGLNEGNPGRHAQHDGLIRSEMHFLPFAGAGTLGIRRSLFEEIGGFDASLRCYEEADLCWRLQLSGHEPPTLVTGAILHYRLQRTHAIFSSKAVAFGQTQALLYRRYRRVGMPRDSVGAASAAWIRLLRRWFRRMAGSNERALVWETSLRLGRLEGSLRYRVPYF
jgi:glycosyltransferase involved in cell wall biosynthesis